MRSPSSASKTPIAKAAALALVACIFAPLAAAPSTAQAQATSTRPHAAGRILVMPRAGLPEAALGTILRENGASGARRIGRTEIRIVDVPVGQEAAAVQRLSRNPHIDFAELDRQLPEALVSNDPYLGSQWHLPKIRANTAWDSAQGTGVVIAILDSGIDTQHPDFAGRLVSGYNFVDGNTNVEDVRSHGTKVAGSAAAALNNGIGVASVAGLSKIMPVRVSDSAGSVYISKMAQGLTWAADNGARIANMSFNGVAGSSTILSAAKYLKDRGGLSFVSAGNDNIDPGYASTSSVIIVSATDENDAKASFSNYGDHVHLSAPGSAIYSTSWGQTYASVYGTSFSAPIAAGVAALVMSANPSLTSTQVENILFSSATDLGAPGRDVYFGYGRVDAAAAVAAALKTVSTSDATPPTVSLASPLAGSTIAGIVPVNVTAADNVGVSKVELRVNGALVATDTSAPFGFSWDSTKVANGNATLVATAYDAAGNAAQSAAVAVVVANTTVADTLAPTVTISNPVNGSRVSGTVSISAAATDDAGTAGIQQTLYINGGAVATAAGGSLLYRWNTRKLATGTYKIDVVAKDAAGNASSTSVSVTR